MEFLGVGPLELLVILVLILIVVGPARLPEMAARLARLLRTARRYAATVTKEFNETMHDLEKEYDDMQGEWKEIGQGLDDDVRAIGSELEAATQDAREAAEQATKAVNEDPSKPAVPPS